jgi:lipid-binding SYLF domain-containing protein
MPTSELLHCHGVAFTTVFKAGVGVGVGKGHGFVIAKLPNDVIDEPAKWSAPLFLTVGAGSIGATLGWSSIDSVSCIFVSDI